MSAPKATEAAVAAVQQELGCEPNPWSFAGGRGVPATMPDGEIWSHCSTHHGGERWTERGCPVAVAAADAATNGHGQPPAHTEHAALIAKVAEMEWKARAQAAEAEAERLRQAMEELTDGLCECRSESCVESAWRMALSAILDDGGA